MATAALSDWHYMRLSHVNINVKIELMQALLLFAGLCTAGLYGSCGYGLLTGQAYMCWVERYGTGYWAYHAWRDHDSHRVAATYL